jgi:hypothetical protein
MPTIMVIDSNMGSSGGAASCGHTPNQFKVISGLQVRLFSLQIAELAINGMARFPIWQCNYYEHVIRDERDYQNVFDYILTNPGNWEKDTEYST